MESYSDNAETQNFSYVDM